MKDIDELKKIAVLIDADNAQFSKLRMIIEEISGHGHIVVKRAYGDWSSENLKNWKSRVNELAIHPVQQFSYTTGKNSTDAAMIIDAMDLLYTNKFDAFAIVSSDSDFTKLASRLREAEIFVFGVGETKTPISFRNACDDFIFTENLQEARPLPVKEAVKAELKEEKYYDIDELLILIEKAWELYCDDDGWVNISSAGTYIKRLKPDFDARSYGFKNLPELIAAQNDKYEMTKYKGKGTVKIIAYKPLEK